MKSESWRAWSGGSDVTDDVWIPAKLDQIRLRCVFSTIYDYSHADSAARVQLSNYDNFAPRTSDTGQRKTRPMHVHTRGPTTA